MNFAQKITITAGILYFVIYVVFETPSYNGKQFCITPNSRLNPKKPFRKPSAVYIKSISKCET